MAPLAIDLARYERRLREQGFSRIAGADEAGRGALAGPLVAAAVILPEGFDLEGIRDSKLLTAKGRDRAYDRIVAGSICWAVCRAMPSRIDHRGLHRSNLWLLRRAVTRLSVEPDFVLTDGFPVYELSVPCLSIKKGDMVTASVAAASIVAKVTRDRMMDRYHRRFPGYGFDRHRGYGTIEHRAAIDRLGPSPIHRLSFKGVAPDLLSLLEEDTEAPEPLPLEGPELEELESDDDGLKKRSVSPTASDPPGGIDADQVDTVDDA